MSTNAFGLKLRELRADLSQKEFAKLLNVAYITYQYYEYGRRTPSDPLLSRLANALGTTVDNLLSNQSDTRLKTVQLESMSHGGIKNADDLLFISGLINQSYFKSTEQEVTADWLSNYFQTFDYLISKENNSDSLAYISRLFKFSKRSVPFDKQDKQYMVEFVTILLRASPLLPQARILSHAMVLLCLGAKFELSENDLTKINDWLTPWCYWVAKRSLVDSIPNISVDLALLTQELGNRSEKVIIDRGSAKANINLAQRTWRHWYMEKKELNCSIDLDLGQEKRRVSIGSSISTLNDLIKAVLTLKSGKPMAEIGKWILLNEIASNAYLIDKDSVKISLTRHEMEDFLALVVDIANHKEVKKDLAVAFAEEYGAL